MTTQISTYPEAERRLAPLAAAQSPDATVLYPILLNSIPKAGSSLLRAIVLAMPGAYWAGHIAATRELKTWRERLQRLQESLLDLRPGSVYAAHLPYAPEIAQWLHAQGMKQFFLYRDPRDITVSLRHFVMQQTPAPFHVLFTRLGSDEERLMAVIRGIGRGQRAYEVSRTAYPSVRLDCEVYLDWMSDSESYALRYEDFVSSTPGQRADAAGATVAGMLAYLGLPGHTPDAPLIEAILSQGMDPARSYTFRRGSSGAWREEYTPEHLAAFRSVAGDLLERLGYA